MAIQWGGFQPDVTPQYASALAALMGQQTRREALTMEREKGLETDWWKRGFMGEELAQRKEIEELKEKGRMARWPTPKVGKPLTPAAQAWNMLMRGEAAPPSIGQLGLRKRAGVLPDWFQTMMEGMEKDEKVETTKGKGEKLNLQIITDLFKQMLSGAPIEGVPSWFKAEEAD